MAASWDALVVGTGCPYDLPRRASTEYLDHVAKLSISSLCLTKNQAYRGSCALIFDARHATRLDELSPEEWALFAKDLFLASGAIVRALRPDHVNLALLGNTIPHLHWGIIPRYRDDPRWGQSIWMTTRAEMAEVRLADDEFASLVAKLRSKLAF